jgi:glycosyltransferase involved in cell wall biosynthesis
VQRFGKEFMMLLHNIKVAHLTSAHPRNDSRIFLKMCSSLASNGYSVSLVVADGKGDDFINGVSIVDVGGNDGSRFNRMIKTTKCVLLKAIELDADIYHFHDPELIPVGIKLKKLGKKVIFDSHEDVGKDILSKKYLKFYSNYIVSYLYKVFEKLACAKLDAIIAATPYIRDKFLDINPNSVDINNFPLLGELENTTDWIEKRDEVVYVGGIARIRGIEQLVKAFGLIDDVRLNLAGVFSEQSLEDSIKKLGEWGAVNELGFLNRQEVNAVLAKSKAGLVTLHPIINYIDALPVKMFEYMAAGIPVIASNFSLWREIVEGNQCGVCVDPLDPKAIGEAIQYLIDHPAQAEQMGKNGRNAVEEKYNWTIEEQKLLVLYGVLAK